LKLSQHQEENQSFQTNELSVEVDENGPQREIYSATETTLAMGQIELEESTGVTLCMGQDFLTAAQSSAELDSKECKLETKNDLPLRQMKSFCICTFRK